VTLRPTLQVLVLTSLLCLSSGCYLSHLAFGQLDVAMSTIDVEEAFADPSIDERTKEKIRFVAEVKQFAVEHVGMEPTDNYSTFLPGEPDVPLTWIVTASERLELKLLGHWYLFVGTVTYKGFFDKDLADEEAEELREDGYDVMIRPVAAYSTLGWFTDPLTPMMLNRSEPSLADLILHELTHGEVYASGQTDFNESMASFVGFQAALEFSTKRWGADSAQVRWLKDSSDDEKRFDVFIRDVKGRLEAVYASSRTDEEKLAARAVVFRDAVKELEEIPFKVSSYAGFSRSPLNNAIILAYLSYRDTDLFEALFIQGGESWEAFFKTVRSAAGTKDPFRALQNAVQED